MKISSIILTKNEEDNIVRAVKSVSFCDEIIIIDDYSNDKTLSLINKDIVKVFKRRLEGDFASQRNFGMSKAAGDWILFIDADEEATEDLAVEIKSQISNYKSQYSVYYIKRRDYWWGTELKYGETRKIRQSGLIRLVKKNEKKWMGKVHEVFLPIGKAGKLNSYINHYPHPTLSEFLAAINNYSTLRVKELMWQGKQTNILEIIFLPFGKFMLNYFIYLGFLDGPAGFAYSFFMSFHSLLVRLKLYQKLYLNNG